MLASARLQTLIWSDRFEEARRFYSDVLGLAYKGMSDGALLYDVGGSDLRISPVPGTGPTEHTVAGFAVPDVRATVRELVARGVKLELLPFPRDEDGLVTTPDGAKVAWFRDPDGNILSVVQLP